MCYSNEILGGDLRMNDSPDRLEGTIDPKLLEILVCPVTKGPLEFDASRQELVSRSAKLAYPIRDGIPIMLPEEAGKIDGALPPAFARDPCAVNSGSGGEADTFCQLLMAVVMGPASSPG